MIHGKALKHVFLQNTCSPYSKLRCFVRVYAVPLAAYVESRSSETITSELNEIYGREESAVEDGFAQVQLESISHEAW